MTNGVCLNTELRLQWRETDNWQLRRQEKKKKIGEGLFYIQMALKVIKYPGKNSRQTNFVIQNIFNVGSGCLMCKVKGLCLND